MEDNEKKLKNSPPIKGLHTSPIEDDETTEHLGEVCYWNGTAYSPGAKICIFEHSPSSSGTEYICVNGRWAKGSSCHL